MKPKLWTAFDNTTGECNMEEFKSLPEAYLWATGQIQKTDD